MAESQTDAERTEEPTPRRMEKAHKKGQVARSQELSGAAILLAGTCALALAGGEAISGHLTALMHECGRLLSGGVLDVPAAVVLLRMIVVNTIRALVPLAVGLFAVALTVNLVQARGVFSAEPIKPKAERVSPLSGLKRIFSWQAPFTLVKNILKLGALGLVTYLVIRSSWSDIVALAGHGSAGVAYILRRLMFLMAVATGLAFLFISAIDFLFQFFQHKKQLRMTKHEVLEEHKETEGDPLIKSRIRSLAIAMSRKRMLADVKDADVVVTNPTHFAVALKYDLSIASAPIVLAMGQRKLAMRIKQIANEAGVPLVENRALAQALVATAKVGQPIPPALYTAVAEVIAFVYRMRSKRAAEQRSRAFGGGR